MPEGSSKPFVVTDRRRFTTEGEVRPDAPPADDDRSERARHSAEQSSSATESAATTPAASGPQPIASAPRPTEPIDDDLSNAPSSDFPAPTEEQSQQSRIAYEQTADRLDTAIRATNPGMDHPPAANFEQLVQSLYMTAIVQLGGVTPEGQKPQIDLLGARQSIDMLGVLGDKTQGNLSGDETKFLESALFELRMAFLEITQVLARSAAARGPEGSPVAGAPGPVGVKR